MNKSEKQSIELGKAKAYQLKIDKILGKEKAGMVKAKLNSGILELDEPADLVEEVRTKLGL